MDIAELKARLDEDEAVARAAAPGPWHKEPPWRGNPASSPRPGFAVIMDADNDAVASTDSADWEARQAQADFTHIARHDPARVLREVAAKRAIIAELERDPQADDRYTDGLMFALECLAGG